MRRSTFQLGVFVLALVGLGSGRAWAYVREVTSTGVPIAWRNPCVSMHIRADAQPPLLGSADVVTAATQAMAAWSYPQVAATDIRLTPVFESQTTLSAGYDKKNVIVFRQDSWCREYAPVDEATASTSDCYPTSALAVTSIFKNTKTGEIVDADIEFNAVYYAWGDLVGQPSLATPDTADFQNALTHELGHVIGLDHNCYTGNDGPTRPYDNTGSPAVDCGNSSDLLDTIANATMYPSVILSDTMRRTLSPDDELGACEIYPHAHDVCPVPSSDGGCSLAGAQGSARRAWPEMLCAPFILLVITLTVRRNRVGRQTVLRRGRG
jgi:hypothetical protein